MKMMKKVHDKKTFYLVGNTYFYLFYNLLSMRVGEQSIGPFYGFQSTTTFLYKSECFMKLLKNPPLNQQCER